MKKLLLILVFSIPFLLNAQKDHPEVNMLEIGEKAPDFNLRATDGERYQLEDFADKDVLVVLFTCNHCPTAQAYEDKFMKIVRDYSGRGVGFVAISPNSNEALSLAECGYSDLDDSYEAMQQRARYKSFNFPYLYDGDDHESSLKYGPQATPHVFVFDNERMLRYRGRIDDTENPYVEPESKDLINALDALLTGNEPEPATTKTFGCSIKWSWKDEWTKTLQKRWAGEEVSLVDIDVEGIKEVIENETENLRLVNVWATWCGPCVIEFPELVKMYRMYSGRDFELVTISADKPSQKDRAKKFLEEQNASNTNYIFHSDNTYAMFDAIDEEWQGTIPFTLLIAPGGEIIYKHTGAFTPLELRKKIIEFLGRYYADNEE